ncbi:MAG: hypothetical protein LJE91_14675 [Gammaproteobacteria bacterium]|jgi:hypothetical protein|nr:hypothetical protein [Gammaproteobacteria bacterium]
MIAALCMVLFLPRATAADAGSDGSADHATAGDVRYWYDGDERQTVWLESDLVAEFANPIGDGSGTASPRSGRRVRLPSRYGWLQFRRAGDSAEPDTGVPTRASPVFRDTPSTGGPLRTLPGGVIVYLDPALSPADVDAWLIRHAPDSSRRLLFGPNVYFIDTPPGLESLETANRIHETEGVIAATPNWWTERVPR